MHTPDILQAAVVRLMNKFPLWCELFYSLKVVLTEDIPTLMTDGRTMWVNPKFWAALEVQYRPSAIGHEVGHKMLHHCTRGMTLLNPYKQIAADIVVNTLLAKNGFPIHPSWVQPEPKYDGWSFERVYYDLLQNAQKQQPKQQAGAGQGNPQQKQDGGKDEAGDGEGEANDGDQKAQAGKGKEPKNGKGKGQGAAKGAPPAPGAGQPGSTVADSIGDIPKKYQGAWDDIAKVNGTPEHIERIEQETEQQVQQAIATAKMMGRGAAGVEAMMAKIVVVQEEKWQDHLRRYMQSLRQGEYNWARINRTHAVLHRIVAPTLFTEQLGEVVVFRDCSGSCYSAAAQAQFNSNISSILGEAKPSRLHVVDFDEVPHRHYEVDPSEIEFLENPVGGGGTSFRHLFPWIEQQGITPEVVIILTDMYGDFPKEDPGYPVIWASTSKGIKGPFGETIEIK